MNDSLLEIIVEKEHSTGNNLSKENASYYLINLERKFEHEMGKLEENPKLHNLYKHGVQVEEDSVNICKKLSMSEEDTKFISFAARMHDIGKLYIPREILNQERKLTEGEWKLVRQHPGWSRGILIPFFGIGEIALYHHEDYDGSGYLEGRKGDCIPLGSRIIRVLDSYNAMTEWRVYQKTKTKEEAIQEIVDGKGTKYDPEIVDCFVEIMQ